MWRTTVLREGRALHPAGLQGVYLVCSAPEDVPCLPGATVAPGENLIFDFASLFSAQAPTGWSRRPWLRSCLLSVLSVNHCSSSDRWGAMRDSTDKDENLGPWRIVMDSLYTQRHDSPTPWHLSRSACMAAIKKEDIQSIHTVGKRVSNVKIRRRNNPLFGNMSPFVSLVNDQECRKYIGVIIPATP